MITPDTLPIDEAARQGLRELLERMRREVAALEALLGETSGTNQADAEIWLCLTDDAALGTRSGDYILESPRRACPAMIQRPVQPRDVARVRADGKLVRLSPPATPGPTAPSVPPLGRRRGHVALIR